MAIASQHSIHAGLLVVPVLHCSTVPVVLLPAFTRLHLLPQLCGRLVLNLWQGSHESEAGVHCSWGMSLACKIFDAHLPFLRLPLKAIHVWQKWLGEHWQQYLPEA